jgi:O-antigen/teichoic acid export membrane protein
MKGLIGKISNLIGRGEVRSVKAKKNILLSFAIRGVSVFVSFYLVRITLGYITEEEYGIWVTLSAFVAWFGFFDIGLGNGLRNKFAEALAKNQHDLAKTYVSTAYAGIAIIFGGIAVLFLIVFPLIDWVLVFKAPPELAQTIKYLVLIVFIFFIMRLIFGLIGIILTADQRPAIGGIIDPISNLFILIVIVILTKTTEGNLLYLGATLSIVPVIVMIIANIYFFAKDYKKYTPSIKYVNFKYFKELINLGVRFFVIQIAVLIIFSTDSMIITQVLGAEEVTPYDLSRRYLGIAAMVFSLILRPFWSAFTEAIVKDDTEWIKRVLKKLQIMWLLMILGVIFLILVADWAYDIWLDVEIQIPLMLNILMGLYMIIATWNDIFVQFINGSGKIRFQYYASIVVALMNIPLSIWLADTMGLGVSGVILGTCITLFPGMILNPYQAYLIINKKDKGIWSK